jgi:hypothetical protein
MIDSHVHLDADQYPDPSGAIKRAHDAGVSAMVVPGVGPASNRAVIELGRKYPGVIFPALGFHPERFEHSEDDARICAARPSRKSPPRRQPMRARCFGLNLREIRVGSGYNKSKCQSTNIDARSAGGSPACSLRGLVRRSRRFARIAGGKK